MKSYHKDITSKTVVTYIEYSMYIWFKTYKEPQQLTKDGIETIKLRFYVSMMESDI